MARVPIYAKDGTVRTHALVDDVDLSLVSGYTWRLHSQGYATANAATVLMHRIVMGEPEGWVDHWNHNKLDNRRENLRVTTPSQNGQNRRGPSAKNRSSRHRGVRRRRGRWCARVIVGGREYSRTFATEQEAVEGARALRMEHMTHAGS